MAQYGLTPGDFAAVFEWQNAQYAAGRVGEAPNEGVLAYTYSVTTDGRLPDAAAFEDIILRADSNAATLRLRDVARVELGSQDYNSEAYYNGQPAAAIGIYLQPGANAMRTAEGIKARLAELQQSFPDGLSHAVPYDTTRFVQVSIDEVIKRSEEHTSELQSLMRISYAVFCLKKKKNMRK